MLKYWDYADGTQPSECLLPCLSTKIKASVFSSEDYSNHSKFDITFEQTVAVTEYYFEKFSISSFLSSMGGILGLWLGVGVMQIGGYASYLVFKMKSQLSKQ